MARLQKIARLSVGVLAAALVAGIAMLGTSGTALADDPKPTYQVVNYGPVKDFKCITDRAAGPFGQYGAWGDFVDGCTVRLNCPTTSKSCSAYLQTSISVYPGGRVTQNARMRMINTADNSVLRFRDWSCAGNSTCSNSGKMTIPGGQAASVQCNGVRAHTTAPNRASNSCLISMRYED